MPPGFKAYPQDYYQSQQFPADVFDLLPEDHKCFLYRDLFRQLDTTEVDAQYSSQGQRAYAPRQIVSILIYAYSHGVFSSRQIERRFREDLGFPYIAGKNGRGGQLPSLRRPHLLHSRSWGLCCWPPSRPPTSSVFATGPSWGP